MNAEGLYDIKANRCFDDSREHILVSYIVVYLHTIFLI